MARARYPLNRSTLNQAGARRESRHGGAQVAATLESILDGQMDVINTEHDDGYSPRLVVSEDPDFGDGPGVYFRLAGQWTKLGGVPLKAIRPSLSSRAFSLVGVQQDVAIEAEVINEVGELQIEAMLPELFEGEGIVFVAPLIGRISFASSPLSIEQPELTLPIGGLQIIGLAPTVDITGAINRATPGVGIRVRGNIMTEFDWDPPEPEPPPPGGGGGLLPLIMEYTNVVGRPNFNNVHPKISDGIWGNTPAGSAKVVNQPIAYFYPSGLGVEKPNLPGGGKGEAPPPVESKIKNAIGVLGPDFRNAIALDVEHNNISEKRQCVIWAKQRHPNAKIGVYGAIPKPVNPGTTDDGPNSNAFNSWVQSNINTLQSTVNVITAFVFAQLPSEQDTAQDMQQWRQQANWRVWVSMKMAQNAGRPNIPIYLQARPHYQNNSFHQHDWLPKAWFLMMLNHVEDIFNGRVQFGPTGDVKTLKIASYVVWTFNGRDWTGANGAAQQGFWLAIKDYYNI